MKLTADRQTHIWHQALARAKSQLYKLCPLARTYGKYWVDNPRGALRAAPAHHAGFVCLVATSSRQMQDVSKAKIY